MSRYVDLSHTVRNDMPTHPFDDRVRLYQNRYLERDKYNDSRLETGMHAGTHIDIPRHLLHREESVDEWPIERFIGDGCLLNVCQESRVSMKAEYTSLIKEDDIVLLYTGFDKLYGEETYFTQHPVVDEELATFFVERKVKMVGMDLPSPDKYPFNVHLKLFAHNILIIENMTNLDKLVSIERFEVIAFPLKIKSEGAPARVVAKVITSG
jgi:kynurenine formamidase